MNKNVKFKQCYVQVMISKDNEGKNRSFDSDSSKDSQEEVEKCMKQFEASLSLNPIIKTRGLC